MAETKIVTAKVTRRTLELVRQIAARTGEKQYAVLERLADSEYKRVKKTRGK